MLRWLQLALLALAPGLLFGCGEAEGVAEQPKERRGEEKARDEEKAAPSAAIGPKVVFLGDSITAGLHLEAGQSEAFPAVCAAIAAKEGWPFRAVNSGKSGDTSAGGLRKVPWILKMEPALVVVELGGNDGLRGQPLSAIEGNLTAIVEAFQKEDIAVVLLGMDLPPSYGKEYVDGYAAMYERIAQTKNIPLVPGFMQGVGGIPELNYRDGLHPNRAGHEKLAEKILPTLREAVARLPKEVNASPR